MSAPSSPPSAKYPCPRSNPVAHLPNQVSERQVFVVGAGPVGLAAALGLARRGIEVTVLEAADHVSHGSRAICLSRHSLEVLDRLGVWPDLRQQSLAWTGGRSFYGDREVLAFQMPSAEHDVRPPMVNISQGVAEQLLVDAVERTGNLEILWGVRVVDVEPAADGVILTASTVDGERTLRGGWVVAADGARSDIRRLLGLSMRGTSYEGRYIIADIHLPVDLPTERRVWFTPASAPGSTIIMHRQPGDIWRIDYQLRPEEDADHELEDGRIRDRISRHLSWLGIDTPWTLEWSSVYRAHSLSLDDYVHDRVVFVGDAAHLVPIFGVRGLNSGLEDADTLAWQLAAVIRGASQPELLAAYSSERWAAWAQNIASAEKSTRIMSPQGVGDALTRDALLALAVHDPAFRPLIDPRQSTATHARQSPLSWHGVHKGEGVEPGDPLVDQVVDVMSTSGYIPSALFAELGTGFAIVGVDTDEAELAMLREQLAEEFGPEPVTTAVVTSAAGLRPEALRLHDPSFVLGQPGDIVVVRPDKLVLCRVSHVERDRLNELGSILRLGSAPNQGVEPDMSTPPESALERASISLSAALHGDPLPLLIRLALTLSRHVDEPTWHQALQQSLQAHPDPKLDLESSDLLTRTTS